MPQVTFYILEPAAQPRVSPQLVLACELASRCFRNKQRAMVWCEDQQSAEAFDELLWQLPVQSFVPHNLSGEGPTGGAPVEICWQVPGQINRQVLINLTTQVPQFSQRFNLIYDFVPDADEHKQQARDRYKQYRVMGCELSTLPATSVNERQDG
jgi:DNA polymerase-3 subunit chi